MIENTDNQQHDILEFDAEVSSVSSMKIDFGTRIIYFVKLASHEPKTLMLGTIKPGTKLKVRIASDNEPQEANKKKARK